MQLLARCERVATSLNRTLSGDTFPTLSSLDKPVGRSMEQLVNLKFLVKPGKTFTETYAVLKDVYGNECISRTQVFEWFKRFQKGRRETTEDDPRLGRPSTIRGLTEIRGVDKECVRQILHESFNMRKVCAKNGASPHFQAKGIKNEICSDILNNTDTDPGLLDTVTLKGTRFESVEVIRAKATKLLNQLIEEDFQHYF
ncbi:hypothetical protein NQ318_010379 [Aromia moschata]|uniref:Mos1 transposase HTH domain-containing protein n=1 Tax=Aromia moschata TaxID=1265417 RepID=A0AAV8XV46_9CUCU|nr:hypothetical protein NQ318_010379 [Aromia moschata]